MIDFRAELSKYNFIEVDSNELISLQKELSDIFKAFSKTVIQLSIEQRKTLMQIDELLLNINEMNEKDDTISYQKKTIKKLEDQDFVVAKNFISILDEIEMLCSYNKNLNSDWNKQIKIVWKNIISKISKIGLTKLDCVGSIFDPELCVANAVLSIPEEKNCIVLEEIKSGYYFKGNLIRKSEVIINKI